MRPEAEAVWGCGHEATSPNAVIETRHTGSRPSAHIDGAKTAFHPGCVQFVLAAVGNCLVLRQARNCNERRSA